MSLALPGPLSNSAAIQLAGDWQIAGTAPGAWADSASASALDTAWTSVKAPGTVAVCVGADLDAIGHYDAQDWWYRCRFSHATPAGAQRLRFDGLATLCEVWLNGQLLFTSRNMFVANSIDVSALLRTDNELLICCRSLDHEMAVRKPRPRWKTALVKQQNLRWLRTTLLGRMPGWTPPIQPVGVWKPVWLEAIGPLDLASLDLQTCAEGGAGRLRLHAQLADGADVAQARLRVGEQTHALSLADGAVHGDLMLSDVPLWWPHTHGTPALVPCSVELRSGSEWASIDCGRIGFKAIDVDRGQGRVQLQVNGEPVFCRGACWTTDDFLALHGDPAQLRRTLTRARDAGLNMLRIGGTMTYESDAFYALCDELGILVWQDFMFANMDYPVGDAGFRAEIDREVAQQLGRLQKHVCIAVYCGGSEVEQQAAMLGLPASEWSNEFFAEALPAECVRRHAGIPYFRSSPCEGALPFHVGVGISHYYGVGAYRRPISDVQQAGVKFAAECLGFSNVPEPATVALLLDGATPPAHHPRWKQRQPRDNGAGWDFEDVRDHYLKLLFGLDPIALRGQDSERYFAMSRVVSGEVMRRVYAEWRAPHSTCGGGLVWFLKDLWPGAGWGVIDSTGVPKAAYWDLKRAWSPIHIGITDHGLDGLRLNLRNESAFPLQAGVELALYQSGRVRVAVAGQDVQLPARGALSLQADALLGRFADTTYAYRFGPPQHDVAVARLIAADGHVLSEDFHFPQGLGLPQQTPSQFEASAQRREDGCVLLDVSCDTFLQSVQIECSGFTPDDAYFHLAPQSRRQVLFTPIDATQRKFKAHVGALNLSETVAVRAD